jgi:hypothetical protein
MSFINTLSDWLNEKTKFGKTTEETARFRPYYREAVRRNTSLKGVKLERFVDSTMQINSNQIVERFKNVVTTTQANDAIADFMKANGAKITSDLKFFDQANRDADFNDSDPRVVTGKAVLRSRFFLPGEDVLKETPTQALSDVVQSDLFDYKGTSGLGLYNSVHLDNMRNEKINMSESGMPRNYSSNLEELILPWKAPPQFLFQQNVADRMMDIAHDTIMSAILQAGPTHSLAFNDQRLEVDPFGLSRTKQTFMRNVNSLQPGFKRDRTQSTLPGELDADGMRNPYDGLRDDNYTNVYHNPYTKKEYLDKVERGIGHDILY